MTFHLLTTTSCFASLVVVVVANKVSGSDRGTSRHWTLSHATMYEQRVLDSPGRSSATMS